MQLCGLPDIEDFAYGKANKLSPLSKPLPWIHNICIYDTCTYLDPIITVLVC